MVAARLREPNVRAYATGVAPVPGLGLARFAAWFERACPGGVTGPLRVRLLASGRWNLAREVGDGACCWVVRRPPPGRVLAAAHGMGRESGSSGRAA